LELRFFSPPVLRPPSRKPTVRCHSREGTIVVP
jgi:hypothetical protein